MQSQRTWACTDFRVIRHGNVNGLLRQSTFAEDREVIEGGFPIEDRRGPFSRGFSNRQDDDLQGRFLVEIDLPVAGELANRTVILRALAGQTTVPRARTQRARQEAADFGRRLRDLGASWHAAANCLQLAPRTLRSWQRLPNSPSCAARSSLSQCGTRASQRSSGAPHRARCQ